MDDDQKAKNENELINQRLTWLGTFEGLLFAANQFPAKHFPPHLIPTVGLAFALSILVGTSASNRELKKLKAEAYADWRRYGMPGTAIPVIIMFAWAVILFEV